MAILVSICIATYKRPHSLKRLLIGLNQLQFSEAAPPDVEVVIVDNDAAGSARIICDEMASQMRWLLKYDIEPETGVTYARNRSVANASKEADFIAMLDDDEVPEPQWLEQLLKVQSDYQAEIVTGPVYPYFEDNRTPEWIRHGQFFNPRSLQTGYRLQVAFTNNVLLKKQCLEGRNPLFDHRFAFKGAEDSHLFMKLSKEGYTIVWAENARVIEWIPLSRTNLNWIVQRNFWGWSCYSLLEKEVFSTSTAHSVARALKGLGLVGLGLFSLPFSTIRGKSAVVKSIIRVARGLGSLSGLIGFQGQWRANSSS